MRSEYTDRNIPAVLENYYTFENESNELVHIFVNSEEIITTPVHPFYVPKLGWTSAIKLRAGDILVLSNGEYFVVEAVQHEILESPVKVYNFEVEDFNRQLKKVTKAKSVFPTDDSLFKMLYLAMKDITEKWTGRRQNWSKIYAQLVIYYGSRITE